MRLVKIYTKIYTIKYILIIITIIKPLRLHWIFLKYESLLEVKAEGHKISKRWRCDSHLDYSGFESFHCIFYLCVPLCQMSALKVLLQ